MPLPGICRAAKVGIIGTLIALPAFTLVACRLPWTVRPIESHDSESAVGAPFDAASYAASIWESKVVPAAAHAPAFTSSRAAGHPILVKGVARVLQIENDRLLVDIAPYDGKPDAELAVAHIHGTALRDALPFVQFSQFVNQVDFAHAASALNDRAAQVASEALAGVSVGSEISFAGALDFSGGGLPEIIPVILTRGPGPR